MNRRFLLLAWKNVWRHHTRSLAVAGAVATGIWALLVLMAFSNGMIQTYIDTAIRRQYSHLQVHHPAFRDDRAPEFHFNPVDLAALLPSGSSVSYRVLAEGMLATARTSRGVRITGIDTAAEARVTGLNRQLEEGTLPAGASGLLIGRELARRTGLTLKSKTVITFQHVSGELVSAAFRVSGIYRSGNSRVDELQVYAGRETLTALMGLDAGHVHEAAVLLADIALTDSIAAHLSGSCPDLETASYKILSPDLEMFRSQIALSGFIMTGIVMLTLVFGIVNTMLMAVLERTRETGMLMAVGMRRAWIYRLFVFETILLAGTGLPFGLSAARLTIGLMAETGINLTAFASGMEQYGLATVIYPQLDPLFYPAVAAAVAFTAVAASFYPAVRAARLDPITSLRSL